MNKIKREERENLHTFSDTTLLILRCPSSIFFMLVLDKDSQKRHKYLFVGIAVFHLFSYLCIV